MFILLCRNLETGELHTIEFMPNICRKGKRHINYFYKPAYDAMKWHQAEHASEEWSYTIYTSVVEIQ